MRKGVLISSRLNRQKIVVHRNSDAQLKNRSFSEDSFEPDSRQTVMHREGYLGAMAELGLAVNEGFIEGPQNLKLNRIPAHNAFWFGWFSAYPNTRLIK